jgi:hypothetical protein
MTAKKKKKVARVPMSKRQYLRSIDALDLTVAGQRTARALGLGLRQCQRIAAGKTPVPLPVELLLGLYLRHPDELPQDPLDE